jgi:3-hydroxypropanoate dehydrogenase
MTVPTFFETALDEHALSQLFLEARTFSHWQNKPVGATLLQRVYELARLAPTAANSNPMRLTFVRSAHAKERLKPCLSPANVDKTMSAPVTLIVAEDHTFYEQLGFLYPQANAKSWYEGNDAKIAADAHQNTCLQAAYFILAARACGLDCGPMGGFDKSKVDETFFAGTALKSNLLINLGYGDRGRLHPRNPRLEFEQISEIL